MKSLWQHCTAHSERLIYAQRDGETVEVRMDRMARRPRSILEGNGMRPNSARTGAMQAEAGRIEETCDPAMQHALIDKCSEATEDLDDRPRDHRCTRIR
jgi:hypothetical protein